jgi:UDP-N-acetylmuramate--alanine ligase
MKKIHFVGIGGIGMSGIAEVMLNLGYSISGSDLVESSITDRLKGLGVRFYRGHSADNLGGADTVVISSAIPDDNIELAEARRKGLKIAERAEMLAHIMSKREAIAVSGAHGKTTTTSLITAILEEAGLSPTWINGGIIRAARKNAQLGDGRHIVAEADESDGTFLKLPAKIAVVTNIDLEHMDYFRSYENMKEEYLRFINNAEVAIVCSEDRGIREIADRIKIKCRMYGKEGEICAEGVKVHPDFTEFSLKREKIRLGLIGKHNVLNALASILVGFELGIGLDIIKRALSRFSGIERRLCVKGEVDGVMVIEDYGHHPTEIEKTLQAVKDAWKKRVIVVFQPHRYTRTRDLMSDFARCFSLADELILTEIYPASEPEIPGVTGERLAEEVRKAHPNTQFFPKKEEIPGYIKDIRRPGEIVLVLGAGDINKITEELLR